MESLHEHYCRLRNVLHTEKNPQNQQDIKEYLVKSNACCCVEGCSQPARMGPVCNYHAGMKTPSRRNFRKD